MMAPQHLGPAAPLVTVGPAPLRLHPLRRLWLGVWHGPVPLEMLPALPSPSLPSRGGKAPWETRGEPGLR